MGAQAALGMATPAPACNQPPDREIVAPAFARKQPSASATGKRNQPHLLRRTAGATAAARPAAPWRSGTPASGPACRDCPEAPPGCRAGGAARPSAAPPGAHSPAGRRPGRGGGGWDAAGGSALLATSPRASRLGSVYGTHPCMAAIRAALLGPGSGGTRLCRLCTPGIGRLQLRLQRLHLCLLVCNALGKGLQQEAVPGDHGAQQELLPRPCKRAASCHGSEPGVSAGAAGQQELLHPVCTCMSPSSTSPPAADMLPAPLRMRTLVRRRSSRLACSVDNSAWQDGQDRRTSMLGKASRRHSPPTDTRLLMVVLVLSQACVHTSEPAGHGTTAAPAAACQLRTCSASARARASSAAAKAADASSWEAVRADCSTGAWRRCTRLFGSLCVGLLVPSWQQPSQLDHPACAASGPQQPPSHLVCMQLRPQFCRLFGGDWSSLICHLGGGGRRWRTCVHVRGTGGGGGDWAPCGRGAPKIGPGRSSKLATRGRTTRYDAAAVLCLAARGVASCWGLLNRKTGDGTSQGDPLVTPRAMQRLWRHVHGLPGLVTGRQAQAVRARLPEHQQCSR